MDLVSIIIPVYNVEKYLSECLQSICSQTYSNLEIILVDDGSTDSSGRICDDYQRYDDRIKVIHKTNEGLGMARNTGLENATGDYILFCDSDDWIEKSMVSVLIHNAVRYKADMVCCGYNIYYSSNDIREKKACNTLLVVKGKKNILQQILYPMLGADAGENLDNRKSMSTCLNLYSKKIIDKNSLKFVSEREYLTEDLFFNISYLFHISKVVIIPDCLYFYRYNSSSLSHKYRPDKLELLKKMFEKISSLLEQLGIKQYCGYRIERSYLMRLRNHLLIISGSEFPKEEKVNLLKRIVNDAFVQKTLSNYPLNVPLRENIMVWLIQRRKYMLLGIYVKFQIYVIFLRDKRRYKLSNIL